MDDSVVFPVEWEGAALGRGVLQEDLLGRGVPFLDRLSGVISPDTLAWFGELGALRLVAR